MLELDLGDGRFAAAHQRKRFLALICFKAGLGCAYGLAQNSI